MSNFLILISSAFFIGVIHTITGPDHYVPFIVLSKAKKWNISKTMFITFLCGLGHILSSVLIAFIAVILGWTVSKLNIIEKYRGELAVWILILFGFLYFIYGMKRAFKKKIDINSLRKNLDLTLWILFIIFIFGPCEPLMPLLVYPALKGDFLISIIVASFFGIITISTMLLIVFLSCKGLEKIKKLERYSHALAGLIIFITGGILKIFNL